MSKHNRDFRLGQNGFTLVESMTVGAMLTGVALLIMDLMSSVNRANRGLSDTLGIQSKMAEIRLALSVSKANCLSVLGLTSATSLQSLTLTNGTYSLARLQWPATSNSKSIVSLNSNLLGVSGGSGTQVSNISLRRLHYESTNWIHYQQIPPSGVKSSYSLLFANLEVTFQTPQSTDASAKFGLQRVTRSLPLGFVMNSAGNPMSCFIDAPQDDACLDYFNGKRESSGACNIPKVISSDDDLKINTRSLVQPETRMTISQEGKVGIRTTAPRPSDLPVLDVGKATTAGIPSVKFDGPVTIAGKLSVTGGLTLSNNLMIQKPLTFAKGLMVNGDFVATQNDQVNVTNEVRVKKLVAQSSTEVKGRLDVQGNSTVNQATNVGSDLRISGGLSTTSLTSLGRIRAGDCNVSNINITATNTVTVNSPSYSGGAYSIPGIRCPDGQFVNRIDNTGQGSCASITVPARSCSSNQFIQSLTSAGIATCGTETDAPEIPCDSSQLPVWTAGSQRCVPLTGSSYRVDCSDYSSLMCKGGTIGCSTINGVTKCPEIKGGDTCRLFDSNTSCVGVVDRVGTANNSPSCELGVDVGLHPGHTLSATSISGVSVNSKIPPYNACDSNRQDNVKSDVARCCKLVPVP